MKRFCVAFYDSEDNTLSQEIVEAVTPQEAVLGSNAFFQFNDSLENSLELTGMMSYTDVVKALGRGGAVVAVNEV